MAFTNPTLWQPIGISELEPNAWTALRHTGSTCVVAGPGAGKTEFLAQRAAFLLQTGTCKPPHRILAISFKRDAAANLAERVRKRCPPEQAARFVSMTFDSFTKSLVDRFLAAIPKYWRPTYPYEVVFPGTKEINKFLDLARLRAPAVWQPEIGSFRSTDFESHQVGGRRLPIDKIAPTSGAELAVLLWWDEYLRRANRSALTFVLINRLAELLLRTNPHILRALRLTYPYVFVDEFQDTTYAQYDFLLSAFCDDRTVVTAVGDDKQRIMKWAGAREDAFAKFETDFGACRMPLLLNFRSSPDLVRIQHVVARALDSEAVVTHAKSARTVDGDVAQIWTFKSEASEAEQVAAWLSSDMKNRGTTPRDYALIVRQTADRFEAQFAGPFANLGLGLRNESKLICRTTLQDLLVEELTYIALAVLRLGAERKAPQSWAVASHAVLRLRAIDQEDEAACQRAEGGLADFLSQIRTEMHAMSPSPEKAQDLADRLFAFLDLAAVARTFSQYGTGNNLAIVVEAFNFHLGACSNGRPTWKDCLDAFEGLAQLPLMTVHKSKGLEYDTILFIGLDDKMWWSYTARDPEGLATFFVALSRAKQRAIFTFCQERGGRAGIKDLYRLLAEAGVPEVPF
jgi:superfamily I DNA/RNA helicase